MAERVILFDGVCNFCSFWVRFVIRRDPKGLFRFAPLQSPMGREACRYYVRSTARLRDMVYSFIANNRYRWFGKNDACFVPTPEIRARFLS